MSQALYRKWRSQTFAEVVGQEHVTQTLRNALRDGRIAHAYLFSGPRGTGKTSTARILAKALNCTAPEAERPCGECATCVAISEGRMIDLIEIDAASNNSVEDIRELRDKVGFRPSEGRFKVYIIDEVHMLSTSAFNALLKTLEEPPPHARFVLATTEPHRIPATVLSRCQRFDFRRIPVPEITEHLQHIATEEGFSTETEALSTIARSAQGCMRDAISLLDQMFSYGVDTVTVAQVQQVLGAVNAQSVNSFVDALADQDIRAGLTLIQQMLTQGISLVEFCHQVVEHLRGVLVLQMTEDPGLLSELPTESVRQMQGQAQKMDQTMTLWAIKRFGEAVSELKGGYQPQLPLEMALIESIRGSATAVAAAVAPTVAAAAATAAPPTTQPSATQTPATQQPEAEAPSPPDAPEKSEEGISSQPGADSAADEAASEPAQLDQASIDKLRHNWNAFSLTVREKCGFQVQAALKAIRDVAVADNTVAFAFGKNEFSRNMVDTPQTKAQVTDLLSAQLGRPVTLECQMGDQAQLSSLKLAAQPETTHDGVDPLVEYAVAELGAQVAET